LTAGALYFPIFHGSNIFPPPTDVALAPSRPLKNHPLPAATTKKSHIKNHSLVKIKSILFHRKAMKNDVAWDEGERGEGRWGRVDFL